MPISLFQKDISISKRYLSQLQISLELEIDISKEGAIDKRLSIAISRRNRY